MKIDNKTMTGRKQALNKRYLNHFQYFCKFDGTIGPATAIVVPNIFKLSKKWYSLDKCCWRYIYFSSATHKGTKSKPEFLLDTHSHLITLSQNSLFTSHCPVCWIG